MSEKESKMGNNKKVTNIILYVGLLLVLLSLVVGLNISQQHQDKSDSALESLTYFKNFSLPRVDGGTFTQDNLKEYKVTVVNGWGPWCGTCVSEIPYLEELSQEMKDKGVQIIGVVADYQINVDNGQTGYIDQITYTIDKTGLTYPILLADQRFSKEVTPTMNNSFPGTWIVDNNGNLLYFVSGAKDKETWTQIINSALEGGGQ